MPLHQVCFVGGDEFCQGYQSCPQVLPVVGKTHRVAFLWWVKGKGNYKQNVHSTLHTSSCREDAPSCASVGGRRSGKIINQPSLHICCQKCSLLKSLIALYKLSVVGETHRVVLLFKDTRLKKTIKKTFIILHHDRTGKEKRSLLT